MGDTVLKIEVQVLEELALVRCSGRIVQGWETAALRKAVLAQERPRILLDLAHVTTIDAGGLGLLIELQNWAEATHRKITLVNPVHAVRDVLETTRLNSVLVVCQEDAVAHHAA